MASTYIAALPMYDWPECQAEVDRQWVQLRDRLRARGIDAPDKLVRCNADMPPIPGDIHDFEGNVIAPDPATLPPDELDLWTLWRHPALLISQTCWGPMELDLARHVEVVGQQDYSSMEGGAGECYSSAIVTRRLACDVDVPMPSDGNPVLPLPRLRGTRLAYNNTDSMSGTIALQRDLAALNEDLGIFSTRIETRGHRNSIIAVAERKADFAAIDCFTWHLAQRFEPAVKSLCVVGWTARRKGLPFIVAKSLSSLDLKCITT